MPREEEPEDVAIVSFEDLVRIAMNRRRAMSTGGKVAIAAVAAAAVAGSAAYLWGQVSAPPPTPARTVTLTATQTLEKPVEKTVERTATLERTATVERTATLEKTATVEKPVEKTVEKTIEKTVTPTVPLERLNTLIIVWNTEFDFLDPRRQGTITPGYVNYLCYERLIQFDTEGMKKEPQEYKVVPALATKYEVIKDGKAIVFNMRKDVKFYPSGNPVDAKAVKFTIDTIKVLGAFWAYLYDVIESIDIIDDYTPQLNLKEPWISIIPLLASSRMNIIDPEVMKFQRGSDYGSQYLTEGRSMGSGPFYVERFTREVEFVLRRNPTFNPALRPVSGKLERIIIKHVPEPTDQALALVRGDADIAHSLNVDQFNALKRQSGMVGKAFPIFRFWDFAMNLKFFKTPKTRLAAKYAIDYDGIVKDLGGGLGEVNQSYFCRGLLGYNPKFAFFYKRDVEKAKQILKEEGAVGLEFPISYIAGFVSAGMSHRALTEKVASDLEEVGFKPRVVGLGIGPWVEKVRTGNLECWVGGISASYPDNEWFSGYALSWGKQSTHFEDAELTKINDEAKRTFDEKKRVELYNKFQQLWLERGSIITLLQISWPIAWRDQVKDYVFVEGFQTAPTVYKTG